MTWIAYRLGMSCPITTADLLAKIDDGAEQVSEDCFVWGSWVICRRVCCG